jgi:1,4-alpha-glucan branching enzyme
VYRKYHQNELTFSSTYAFQKIYVATSHDEVVHGKIYPWKNAWR